MRSTFDRRRFLKSGTAVAAGALLPGRAEARSDPASSVRYQLGIVTYNIAAQWDVPTILKICKTVGLSSVELRTTHKHGVEPSINADKRGQVRKQFQDAGVVIWGLGTVCEFQSPDQQVVEKHIETCKQFVQLAADLGARGVKVRPNGLPKGVPVEKTLEQIGKALIPCGKAAADAGVEIWVEVHGSGTSHPPHMKSIMEHCRHNAVGITWNSNRDDVKGGSITSHFDLLRPWIKSCHINELWNEYPWRELFTRLRETGYDRVTLAEIPGMPDPASGERLMRYYKALWAELTK